MAMTKGVMVRAALSQAPRWKRISTARFRKQSKPSTPARSGAARPAGGLGAAGAMPTVAGFAVRPAIFILTYDATTGEAQNTAYR